MRTINSLSMTPFFVGLSIHSTNLLGFIKFGVIYGIKSWSLSNWGNYHEKTTLDSIL